jgi:RsiW-degrading membrane proteinase PrsW (M82 family)
MTRKIDIRHMWLVVIPLAGLAVAAVNIFLRHDLPADPIARFVALQKAGLPAEAEPAMELALGGDPENLFLNYRYINNHFDIKGRRDDEKLARRYQDLTKDEETADLGNYGLGLIESRNNKYDAARRFFQLVFNRRQKYLNNSIGYALMNQQRYDEAETYFQREIEMDANVEGAVSNLVNLYQKQRNWKKLAQLARDDKTGRFVGTGTRRYIAFRSGDIVRYAYLVFFEPLRQARLSGIAAALFICLTWFVFFWRVDIFEQEPIAFSLTALALGGLSTFFVFPLGDALYAWNAVRLNGQALNDLIYSVLHVGVVEEAVKLAPVFLILLFTRQVNEPIDLIIYGSLSALGFATVENVLYFTSYGLNIAYTRFLSSTVLHMAMTGFVCYCWARARYIRVRSPVWAIGFGFLMSSVAHGLYDYFLIGPFKFDYLSVAILLVLAVAFGRMINNSLNFSPFFQERPARYERLSNYSLMFSAAALLLVLGFVYDNFFLATALANHRLWSLASGTVITVLVVFTSLGDFKLSRSTLLPLLKKQ